MGTMQWARLKANVDVPLRRGAWYRVVAPVTRLEVVVSVQGKRVSVPRPFVEIRALPPRAWTVLRNPTVAPGRTPEIFRRGYIVCPGCRNRVVLPAIPVAKQLCPRCNQTFPIAWDEHYLEEAGSG
jgi:hypothetical protein